VFRNSTFLKSSFSVSNPRYLWRAAPKQVQSIKMCSTVRGEWQIWHSGWFSPIRRYELVSLVWPIRRQLIATKWYIFSLRQNKKVRTRETCRDALVGETSACSSVVSVHCSLAWRAYNVAHNERIVIFTANTHHVSSLGQPTWLAKTCQNNSR